MSTKHNFNLTIASPEGGGRTSPGGGEGGGERSPQCFLYFFQKRLGIELLVKCDLSIFTMQ
jgi:hypothetical protein